MKFSQALFSWQRKEVTYDHVIPLQVEFNDMKPENEATCIFSLGFKFCFKVRQRHTKLLSEFMTDLFYLNRFVS